MSGPKVVRIVTREEIVAICEGHLQRLDQVIASWVAEGRRTGMLSDEEIAATHARREALAALVAVDAFVDLQKQVPDEITFLKADLARRQQAAVDQAEQAAKRRRQGRYGATTLLGALEAKSIEIPAGLRGELDRLRSGDMLENADAVLAHGFALLAPDAGRTLSDAQRALANRLMPAEASADFQAWKAAQRGVSRDPAIDRLDRRIGEARVFLDAPEVEGFSSRLNAVEDETSEARKSLLLDSLILDLSSAIEAARARRAAIAALEELTAEIRAYNTVDTAAFVERARQCDTAASPDIVAELTRAGHDLIVRVRQHQAAEARRNAILSGLARLGYEVHEGMTTAWAKDGRVVVKKPSLPGYGVEVGGQAQAGRLQVRAVSVVANRDVARDKDVETLWCGEFGRLQALLAQHGDDLLIERAMGVGEVPLKVVADVGDMSGTDAVKRTMG
ncbi:hypothetical protein [Burkholderia stagnalis]|uniref:hypothetical protein n=1 Tax=Burkholderia stagnalis TaxID=1503054 RepID=UPI00075BC6FE|nr:hypothetical protein [Burkholderia stagnalis]KVM94371.1 hypothetical protein WT07_28105 [Burkholderia stagnalis]KWE13428.1 hypothetical protein WT47_03210 [Burkholderia stagnalis]KWE17099.1 hypothetical protein WT48_14825 [Burkholderia stagnalis]KWO82958.1 hypothetical protein WU00_30660 [Burkholderia stagnalis]